MRIIHYYDRIHKEFIDIEVTDEVAKFLLANDKWLRRHQNKYDYYILSLETPIYTNDDGENICLEETIAYNEANNDNLDEKTKNLYKLVWKIVSNLKESEQKLIKDVFVNQKNQKQIAHELKISESAISQLKKTAMLHLTYYFYTDNEFIETDLYKRHKREFDFDLKRIAKQIDGQDGLKINLNNVYNLVKDNTQMLKMISSLGIEIDEKQKNLFTYMNRTVKQFLDYLNLDINKTNTLNVPADLEIPKDNLGTNL